MNYKYFGASYITPADDVVYFISKIDSQAEEPQSFWEQFATFRIFCRSNIRPKIKENLQFYSFIDNSTFQPTERKSFAAILTNFSSFASIPGTERHKALSSDAPILFQCESRDENVSDKLLSGLCDNFDIDLVTRLTGIKFQF